MKPASLLPFEIVELGHRLYVHGRYSPDPSRRAGSPIDGVVLQQRKTGAGRGQSPRWTGYDAKERQDFEYFVYAANAHPRLIEERDELLDALRGVMGLVQLVGSGHNEDHTANHRYVEAERVLAKHKPQTQKVPA